MATFLFLPTPARCQDSLGPEAAKLYKAGMETRRFAEVAAKLKPTVKPTTDGRSFYLVWQNERPKRWIASLHGAGRPAKGYASDDLAIWYPHLEEQDVGLICLQWWLGTGDGPEDFLTPTEICHELNQALEELKIQPGDVMLHGFSRGASNIYSVAAIDAGKEGNHYFSLIVASSGGMSANYPPNRALMRGDFGPRPLADTRWITVAGAGDNNSGRDGVEGMKKTAAWLIEQDAIVVESIEDPEFGHGALHLNPKNTARVLATFEETVEAGHKKQAESKKNNSN